MPGRDPDHWLFRLTAEEWLSAARGELSASERALAARQQRTGVTLARRAAGMAWNAVLVESADESGYGRSYMEHLSALARDPSAPAPVRSAAAELLAARLSTEVVQLGRGDTSLAQRAAVIVAHAASRLAQPTRA